MATLLNLSASQLRKAADLQEKINKLQAELDSLFGSDAAPAAKPVKGRRKMSAAARAKIAAAQKARWAKAKAAGK